MIKLALLGKDISHSLSPMLYREILAPQNVDYRLLDFENPEQIPTLDEIFSKVSGLNITAPYKEHFLSQVSISDPVVKKLGAINCIVKSGASFTATNTDLSAMRRLLLPLANSRKILILGDGVMARMTKFVCQEFLLSFEQRSRKINPENFSEMKLEEHSSTGVLIINCCSRAYTFNSKLPNNSTFWDMNYKHQAHQDFFKNNPKYLDGFNLLKAQAIDAAAFFGYS